MYHNNHKDTQYTNCLDLRKGKTLPVINYVNYEKAKVVLFILVCYRAVEISCIIIFTGVLLGHCSDVDVPKYSCIHQPHRLCILLYSIVRVKPLQL